MKKLIIVLLFTTAFSIFISGCISQSEYESLQQELSTTKQELSITQGKLEDTQIELSATQDKLNSTQDKILMLEAKYPLHYFETIRELERWIEQHQGQDKPSADKMHGEALRIQYEAMLDGYLISAVTFPTEEGYWVTVLEAIASREIYWWHPTELEAHRNTLDYYDYRESIK